MADATRSRRDTLMMFGAPVLLASAISRTGPVIVLGVVLRNPDEGIGVMMPIGIRRPAVLELATVHPSAGAAHHEDGGGE